MEIEKMNAQIGENFAIYSRWKLSEESLESYLHALPLMRWALEKFLMIHEQTDTPIRRSSHKVDLSHSHSAIESGVWGFATTNRPKCFFAACRKWKLDRSKLCNESVKPKDVRLVYWLSERAGLCARCFNSWRRSLVQFVHQLGKIVRINNFPATSDWRQCEGQTPETFEITQSSIFNIRKRLNWPWKRNARDSRLCLLSRSFSRSPFA